MQRKRMRRRMGTLLLCLTLLLGSLPANALYAAEAEPVSQEEQMPEEKVFVTETSDAVEDMEIPKESLKEEVFEEEEAESEEEPQAIVVEEAPQTILLEEEPQTILVKAEPEYGTYGDSAEVNYEIKVHKADWQTGIGLEGCEIEIYEDGEKLTALTTDIDGNLSYTVTKSDSFSAVYCSNYDSLSEEKKASITGCTSEEEAAAEVERKIKDFQSREHTYSIREITAPTGYVWQENSRSQSISGGETVSFSITGERTLGTVELVLYDTESESGIRQGDAVLDGAVYGIYAKENIGHSDGKTGILFQEDQLVTTAIVGKSPKRNEDGYILNEDGTRHIEYPEGTVAYEDTPGETLFGDLELGSYYIREITLPKGYMFDEAVYPATFTYKDQMVRIESRNEIAKDAKNELAADDRSTSHQVYSGDYVIKQGIRLSMTSDDSGQTKPESMEGTGYSVYLISELSGVKNGSIKPVNEEWSSDDIPTFYDYDFRNETRASVYKRTFHETWTSGDRRWLISAEGLNKYQVMEMFTDEKGCIETPELPYGTYVFVETTTREGYVAAKPFLISITKDGGVLYTDGTKQTIEKTYTVEEGIRYGDHKATKNREGRVLQEKLLLRNGMTKTFLRVVKADEEFLEYSGAYIRAEEAVHGAVLKEGAAYRLRCLTLEESGKLLSALNWNCDAEGYLSCYDPGTRSATGTKEQPFRTTFQREEGKIVDCYLTLPQEIPSGIYELIEVTAPSGYVVKDREQIIVDTSTDRRNSYRIIDVPRSRMRFFIMNSVVYPDGQMGLHKYALCDRHGNLTVSVLQENREQKGIVQIYKHGEQLAGYEDGVFVYKDVPIEGVSFDIVAAEDIYTQELQKELLNDYAIDPSDYLVHRKDDIVASITTDRNGWGYAAGLYIGKYKIVETATASGFVLSGTEREFEITPQEQTVNFDIHDIDFKNERQKLKVEVTKTDEKTGEPLAGAVFGLYAAEDIATNIIDSTEKSGWIPRDAPEVLISEGTLVATCVTDADGKGIFEEDLPLARYIIRELEAPEGYLVTDKEVMIDGSYDSPDGGPKVPVQYLSASFENQPTDENVPPPEEPDVPEPPSVPEEPDIPEPPTVPEEPNIPDLQNPPEQESDDGDDDAETLPEIPEQNVAAPPTGDHTCWYVWAAGALMSAGILLWTFRKKKKE